MKLPSEDTVQSTPFARPGWRSASRARFHAQRVRLFWGRLHLLPDRSSLQQLMLWPFSAQLLFSTLLVLGIGYGVATQIIDQLCRELGQQIGERVLQEIKSQLNAPRQVNAINAQLLTSGLISKNRLHALSPLLQSQLEAFPGLGYVQVGSPDGSYVALERNQQSGQLELSRHGAGLGVRPLPIFSIGAQGQPIERLRSINFDARETVWFRNAIENPYVENGFSTIFGEPQHPLGVVGADIWPVQLTNFLQSLSVGNETSVFVVDRRGMLVASSSPQQLYSIKNNRLVRQKAVEVVDPVVRDLALSMQDRFGQEIAERLTILGRQYMLVTNMYKDPTGFAWQVLVATPEDNYLAEAKNTLRTGLLIIALGFGASLLISRRLASIVASPLQRVAMAADGMANGDLDQRLQSSAVDEVNDLTLSFNSMAGQLRQSYGDLEALSSYQESILESMPSGVLTFSEEGILRSANSPALEIFDCTPEVVANTSCQELFQGENSWLSRMLFEVYSKDETRSLEDVVLSLPAGDRSVNLVAQPLRDPRIGLIGTMLMLEDISEEKRLKGTMARYMDPRIAESLFRSGADVLGGVESTATVLFSDIRSFTRLTEQLGPQGTVGFLNEYFTLMVECLSNEGGMLDKFIGDAVMAVFGLPSPTKSDEDHAIRSAIAMQEVLSHFNVERQLRGESPISIGIGLHTDIVVSGNIGSPKRMNYTVIGDGVNLASRLESACKFYGASVLVSDATLRRSSNTYCSRPADYVIVKGKSEPVLVHELLDFVSPLSFPERDLVVERYQHGLEAYRSRAWSTAIDHFEAALMMHAQDRLSSIYLERSSFFLENEPPDDWDGVWRMTSK